MRRCIQILLMMNLIGLIACAPSHEKPAPLPIDITTWQELTPSWVHRGRIDCLAFSPGGKILASGGYDKTIRLWEVAPGRQINKLTGHKQDISSIAFSKDGRFLASADATPIVIIWDVVAGKEFKILKHDSSAHRISFSPDDKVLACIEYDKGIKLWDTKAWEVIKAFTHSDVKSLVFSPDGKLLASGGYGIILWDMSSGEQIKTLSQGESIFPSTTPFIAFSPLGNLIAYIDGYRVMFWKIDTTEAIEFCKHQKEIRSIVFCPHGTILATVDDREVKLWDVSTGNLIKTISEPERRITAIAFDHECKRLATGSWDGIKLWETST